MLRILLYILTNAAVLFVFGIVLTILGIDPQSFVGLLMFAGIFGFAGSFISLLFSKNAAKKSVNAKIIDEPTTDEERWLMQNIRELADKLDIGMPEVGIYQSNDLNAFATGANKNKSLVCASTGLLRSMDKDEVLGVLGHEMSHIANGDMVTMSLLQGIMNTFVIFFAKIIAQMLSSNKDGKNSYATYSLVYIVLQTVFGFLASLIIFWFSRHREYRADAGSVQLLGKQKMIKALQCLQRHSAPQEKFAGDTLKFGINGNIASLLSTHPPLEKRIENIQTMNSFN